MADGRPATAPAWHRPARSLRARPRLKQSRTMFTGIITDIGTVRSVEQRGDLRLTIGCGYDMDTVDLGASIACSGACLTVVDKGADWFAVDVSEESVRAPRRPVGRGRAAQPRAGAPRSATSWRPYRHRPCRRGRRRYRMAQEAAMTTSTSKRRRPGQRHRPQGLDHARRRVADRQRGEDAGDGTTHFTVNLIPHTADHTTLGGSRPGGNSTSRSTCWRAI